MKRLFAVLSMALAAAAAFAQIKIQLEFPGPGSHRVWVAPTAPNGKWPEATVFHEPAAEFSPAAFGPSDRLYVLDERTGNLASRPMSEVTGAWKLAKSDFSQIGALRVRVEHQGRPVESAGVTLTVGKQTRNAVIDSASAGEAVFFGIPPGQVGVSIAYKTKAGETPNPIKQTSEFSLNRAKAEAVMIVSIPDEVATTSAVPSGETTAPNSDRQESRQGGFGNLLSFVLAVAVAAIAVFFGLKWLKANQDRVQSKLSSLGVEIPGSEQKDDGPAATVAPIAPPPPAQILLEDAAPVAVATAPSPPITASGEPRFVSADGDVLTLDEGTLTVGREAGLGLSLINESTVSRNHAEVVRNGPTVRVRDMGSTNGTFVNGVAVQGEVELRPGDQVQFGAVRFRFEG